MRIVNRFGSIRGAVLRIFRGGAIRDDVSRDEDVEDMLEPKVRTRFQHSKPKLYVGKDRNTAVQIAKYAESRKGTPPHILSAEVRHFFAQG